MEGKPPRRIKKIFTRMDEATRNQLINLAWSYGIHPSDAAGIILAAVLPRLAWLTEQEDAS